MPEFRTLEAFYWVAQLGSFRQAAERLNLTQSAVSQRVAMLEADLGIRVLDRETRKAAMTPKGRQVFDYADRLLRLRSDLLASVAVPSAYGGTMRLGVAETIVHTWLARFIERAHVLFPNVRLDIEVDVTPGLRQGLMRQELDLAFLLGPVNERRTLNLELCRYPLGFVRSPGLAVGEEPVGYGTLATIPIITYPRTTSPYLQVQQLIRRPDLPPPRVFGNSSLSTIVKMTLDRIGLSVIPPIVVRGELEAGELVQVATVVDLPDLVFTASWVTGPDSALPARLADLAKAVADGHLHPD